MIKAIMLDCGGVMVAPVNGDWLLPPAYEEVLGTRFVERIDEFRKARAPFLPLLPDTRRIDDDETECALFIRYFDAALSAMGVRLGQEQLKTLASLQTYRDDRYIFFDDVVPFLRKWSKTYRLGIVSDAPPSTRRIMQGAGVLSTMQGVTFSCDLGVLKPDPRIYQATLSQLGVQPEEAIFVDDIPEKLEGATRLGVKGIQMRRPMPSPYAMPSRWDGPVAHDFAELDTLLKAIE